MQNGSRFYESTWELNNMNIQDFNYQQTTYGIELRDYFAAKAMQGLMDAPMSNAEIADEAYQMADLMMKAREKNA
jgi:hypothetical protein